MRIFKTRSSEIVSEFRNYFVFLHHIYFDHEKESNVLLQAGKFAEWTVRIACSASLCMKKLTPFLTVSYIRVCYVLSGSFCHVILYCSYDVPWRLFTFRVSRRPQEMYCGHARLCVCLSVCLCVYVRVSVRGRMPIQYCTDPDVTWGSGRGCPLVVHYWADLQVSK